MLAVPPGRSACQHRACALKSGFIGVAHRSRQVSALFPCALAPASAFAHSEAAGSGLMAGLLHPVTGLDHLLAMLAVGILSVRLGGANIWRLPLVFVLTVVTGAWAGSHGWQVAGYEAVIAWSVVVLGLAIAFEGAHHALALVFFCVALFGLCHGYAHGVEMPGDALAVFYATGFLVTTVFIHVVGIFVGEFASGSRWHVMALRVAGVAMTLAGVWFVRALHAL